MDSQSEKKRTSVIAPGQMARDIMEHMKYSSEHFARQLGLSEEALQQFFDGQLALDRNLALALKNITGVTATFWQNFERQYRHRLRCEEKKRQSAAEQD